MKKVMSVAEVKKHFSEVLESIVYLGDRFVIQKRGKPVAAIISMKELSDLEERSCSPQGLVAAAGAWSDYEDLDKVMKHIYQARITAKDREVNME
jgi:prevent-host-death family protein